MRAAAAGVVLEMGRHGAYGRLVRIRHGGGLETAYAHFARYAKGLKIGAHVRQDKIIGYVGTSGRVIGSHLHFEVRRHGKAVDPLVFPAASAGGS